MGLGFYPWSKTPDSVSAGRRRTSGHTTLCLASDITLLDSRRVVHPCFVVAVGPCRRCCGTTSCPTHRARCHSVVTLVTPPPWPRGRNGALRGHRDRSAHIRANSIEPQRFWMKYRAPNRVGAQGDYAEYSSLEPAWIASAADRRLLGICHIYQFFLGQLPTIAPCIALPLVDQCRSAPRPWSCWEDGYASSRSSSPRRCSLLPPSAWMGVTAAADRVRA